MAIISQPVSLKILSYNIHKGFSFGNLDFVLSQIRDAIRSSEADLVFLQEVQGAHEGHQKEIENWPETPQFEYIADSVWTHYAYGKNALYQAGHHGNAILSRYPMIQSENIDLSTNQLEKRGLLHAVIEIPERGQKIHTLCVHLDLLHRGRKKQIESIIDRIKTCVPIDEPLILAGDFNDWGQKLTPILQERMGICELFNVKTGAHAKSFPSWMPWFRLDRLYYRGLNPVSATCLTGPPWDRLSDHAALFGELEL
jgi:endonuclease/exonuclease/phosphatase family metal-dependent hydrolase